MSDTVNVKQLRADLARILKRVESGKRVTVVYRSRAVCQIVPLGTADVPTGELEDDALYRAPAVGRSTDGRSSTDHDEVLYGRRGR